MERYRSGEIRLPGSSASQLDLNVLCVQHQALSRPSSAIHGFCQKRWMIYRGTPVDDRTDRGAVAFAVGCDPEESAKGGHQGERKREVVVETKRERGEKPPWFLYQHCLDPAYIRRENLDHRRREFVQMPPQSSVGIYTPSPSSSLSPLTLQNTP